MKINNYFPIFICMISLFVFSSCEHAELQRSSSNTNEKINTRTDDCDDCVTADCCCIIEWVSGSGTIQLCGTVGNRLSESLCGPITDVGTCFDIEGYYLGPFILNSGNLYQLFCMDESTSFMINAYTGPVTVTITCQVDQTNPQTINVTLQGGNRYFYSVSTGCVVEDCS
jgi:hypothetical protein